MSSEVALLPEAYLEEDVAVLGRKGGGKTYTSKGIVERLLEGKRRVLILDPLGVWAGLRTAANGRDAGFPIAIFGGVHGDLPLEPAAAVPMADVIARNNIPAVLDISDLSKTAQQSFLLAFLRELRRVNTEALTLVLEEADVFAPQNPMGDDSKALHAEIDWICRRGRFRGFRLITITQRPARLSKDVLTQAATLIMHRLPAPQDRDAVKAWVDGNGDRDQAKEVFDTLARLDVGEAWVWSTTDNQLQRMRFPKIKTLDTSATPKAGEKRVEPKTLAQVDLGPIKTAMDAAAAERLQRAEPKSGGKNGSAIDPAALKAAEDHGYARGLADGGVRSARAVFDALLSYMAQPQTYEEVTRNLLTDLPSDVKMLYGKGGYGRGFSALDLAKDTANPMPADLPRSPPQAPSKPKPAASGELDGAAMKLLAAVCRYDGITWDNTCIVAGILPGNGYFYKAKKALVEGGYVRQAEGLVTHSAAGRNANGGTGSPATLREIVSLWTAKVGAPGDQMLQFIANHRGHQVTTEQMSAAIGTKPGNGYWYKGVKSIRKANLIDQDKGSFRLSAFLCEASR
ncbi:helicase HerA-like domain-containing protein [Afipia carboxidovorans]|uniref:helicase HerA-like domain-containing protein n=1 Tax=Afipia carboxidovorans TaxID=40137 RepID=UPI00308CD0C7|nr:hypothetical protein CRBSH125_08950 [Afipia carboxidovorans]